MIVRRRTFLQLAACMLIHPALQWQRRSVLEEEREHLQLQVCVVRDGQVVLQTEGWDYLVHEVQHELSVVEMTGPMKAGDIVRLRRGRRGGGVQFLYNLDGNQDRIVAP